eukprot:scaffold115606_cov19-Tisochrysis_lutea.AAC.1
MVRKVTLLFMFGLLRLQVRRIEMIPASWAAAVSSEGNMDCSPLNIAHKDRTRTALMSSRRASTIGESQGIPSEIPES